MTAIDLVRPTQPPPVGSRSDRSPTWLVVSAGATSPLPAASRLAIEEVSAGPAFARRLRELRPCLAIVTTPPADSGDLVAAIAERRLRQDLHLILLNEPSDVGGRLDALALGFDEALPTTIDPVELEGRARLLIGGGRQGKPDRQIEVAPGVALDLVGRRVRRAGVDVHLRPKEFALLALLASDPGRAFSRSELVDRAWGSAYTGGNRTIDVHIRWLRAKIELDPARPAHVITVRGTGYRLDPFEAIDE